jgi:hypothetical protein
MALDNTGHGSVNLPSTGVAPFAAGSYTVNGAYSGDANYQSATAKPMSLTIGRVGAGYHRARYPAGVAGCDAEG